MKKALVLTLLILVIAISGAWLARELQVFPPLGRWIATFQKIVIKSQGDITVLQRVDAFRQLDELTPQAIDYEWIPYYYRHPRPDETAEVIESLLLSGNENIDSLELKQLHHFFGMILHQNKDELEELRRTAQQHSGKIRESLDSIIDKAQRFQPVELKTASDLDFLWAEFMATGNEEIIRRLINVLGMTDLPDGSLFVKRVQQSLIAKSSIYADVQQLLSMAAERASGHQRQRLAEIMETIQSVVVKPARMHLERAYNHGKLRDIDMALVEYQNALKLFPDYAFVYLNLSYTLEYIGKKKQSFAAMRKAYQISPTSPKICYSLGRQYFLQGKYSESIPYYVDALNYLPNNPNYLHALGRSYQELGDTAKAVEYYQLYLKLAPHGGHAHLVRAYLAYANVPIQVDPTDLVTLLITKEYERLEQQMEMLLREKKRDENGRSRLLMAYNKLCDNPDAKHAYEKWLNYFENWLRYDSSSHFANACIGIFYIDYGWHARGTGWGRTVTKEGRRLYRKRLSLAATYLEKAYALDPSDPFVPANLILIAKGLGLGFDEMEKQFQRAIRADRNEYEAYYQKLVYLMPKWHGSKQQMFGFAQESVNQAAPDTLMPLLLANAHWEMYYRSENRDDYFRQPEVWKELKEVFQVLCKRFPDSKERHNWFALTAYLAGDYDTAREELQIIQDDWHRETWGNYQYFQRVKNELLGDRPAKS